MKAGLLFLILVTSSIAQANPIVPCELLLARGPRKETFHDRRKSVRMMTPVQRHEELKSMNAPGPDERDAIFRSAPFSPNKPPATAFVRATIKYILTRTDWTPLQKAVFWEEMAIDIDHLPGIGFGSTYFSQPNGYLFVGVGGEGLLFRNDGKVLRGSQLIVHNGQVWNLTQKEFELLNP